MKRQQRSLNDRMREADESNLYSDIQMLGSAIFTAGLLIILTLYLKP